MREFCCSLCVWLQKFGLAVRKTLANILKQTTPQPRNPRRNPDDDEFDRERDRRAGAGALEEEEDRDRAGADALLRKPRPKPPAGWRSFRPVPSRASKPDKHAL